MFREALHVAGLRPETLTSFAGAACLAYAAVTLPAVLLSRGAR